MAISDDISSEIASIVSQSWSLRDGRVVPASEDISLSGGDGVKLQATMLYSDLADSTALSMWNRQVTAKVIKAFLASTVRIIRVRGGYVRSFDGDRVMGVFLGDSKNTSAAKCALQINWMFLELLKPKFESKYEAFRDGKYNLAHCTGIDTGEVLVTRAGIGKNNDLIWVGRCANIAAKLSAIRESGYHSYISKEVYDSMNKEAKIANDGRGMWEARTWNHGPITNIYRSNWWWKLD